MVNESDQGAAPKPHEPSSAAGKTHEKPPEPPESPAQKRAPEHPVPTDAPHAPRRSLGKVAYDNRDRIVVISGGASGIGEAIAEAFWDSGAEVISLDVNARGHTAPRPRFTEYQCDVADEPQCAGAIAAVVERFGGIDVLVNNAAIQPPASYVRPDEVTGELWERMVAVNLTGYMMLAKHALKVMAEQGAGVVVNIASGQAHRTARDVPVYGPLKAANVMQAMQWGVQYAREGIRVVSVSPGAIDTPLVRASLEEQGGAAALANRHPLGRLGKAEEVAKAVLWLSSGEASFITATDLAVDGGLGAFGAFAEPYSISTLKKP